MYKYKGTVIKCYDADTMTIEFDLGFKIKYEEQIRLYGIDTPELRTKNLKEKALGYKARDFVRELIMDKEFEFKTYKEGKFGRYLCVLYLKDKVTLNDLLISKGYAKLYDGGKKTKWFED